MHRVKHHHGGPRRPRPTGTRPAQGPQASFKRTAFETRASAPWACISEGWACASHLCLCGGPCVLQGGSGRGLGTRRAHLGRAMPRLNRVPLPLPRHGSQPRGHLRHGPEARQPCQRVTRRRAVPFAEARRAVPRPVRRGRGEGGRLGCPWGLGGNLVHRHTVGHALRGLAKVGLPEHGCTCRWCPTGIHPWDPPLPHVPMPPRRKS